MCPILRGKMGLKYAARAGARASEMGGAGKARPRGVVACLYASPTCRGGGRTLVRPEGCRKSAVLIEDAQTFNTPPSPAAQAPPPLHGRGGF